MFVSFDVCEFYFIQPALKINILDMVESSLITNEINMKNNIYVHVKLHTKTANWKEKAMSARLK